MPLLKINKFSSRFYGYDGGRAEAREVVLVKKSHGSWDVTLPVFGVCYGKDNIDFRSGFMAMVGGTRRGTRESVENYQCHLKGHLRNAKPGRIN